jgi:hypothetical protein
MAVLAYMERMKVPLSIEVFNAAMTVFIHLKQPQGGGCTVLSFRPSIHNEHIIDMVC